MTTTTTTTTTANEVEETYIYHEWQDSELCGQHCLNNLLQQPAFSHMDLGDIAIELDRLENELMDDQHKNAQSCNVDNTGNFSFDVLNAAVKQLYDLELVPWKQAETADGDEHHEGFIINMRGHWMALRKIRGKWWSLDSLKEQPMFLCDSMSSLRMVLNQWRNKGSSVFAVHGAMSEVGHLQFEQNACAQAVWWKESQLLRPPPTQMQNNTLFSNIGNFFNNNNSNNNNSNFNNNNFNNNNNFSNQGFSDHFSNSHGGGNDDMDDEDLQLAIALSQSQNDK